MYDQALVSDGCDSDMWARLHYNIAVCQYKLGDSEGCASAAGTYILSNHTAAPDAALRLFFWAMTGQKPPQGMPGD